MNIDDYEKVIGLEIHMRIKSKSKMFTNAKNATDLAPEPNMHIAPGDMGYPGVLPKLNSEVVRLGLIGGMMMNCEVNKISRFDRKTYFYPDNPTAYQITQLYEPIVGKGYVQTLVNGELRSFGIHHMHLEDDAGKLVHTAGRTLVDFNRAGCPLMEIVTEPVFRDKEEVMEFLRELQKMMRRAGVSDRDMDKGQMRCDVNLSIRPYGQEKFGERVELKNLNSFNAVGRAIDHEYKRQFRVISEGGTIDQETRGWDDEKRTSHSQRSKEDRMDYRYFPDPDLQPLVLSDDFIDKCRAILPELPIKKRLKYLNEFNLGDDDRRILSADVELGKYFDELVESTDDPKKSCSYLTTVILGLMSDSSIYSIEDVKITPKMLSDVINMINSDELSSTNAKIVIDELFLNGGDARDIAESKNLIQKNDMRALEQIVDEVIAESTKQIEQYRDGNDRIFGYFVGQAMKKSKGTGNPKIFTQMFEDKISK